MSCTLKIVADENMPDLQAHFAALGEITALAGRAIGAADLRDCDILLVRSVTRVDQALLAGSRVRFVGSATIGTDHIDLDYLAAAGIAFAHAPGCNAESVLQYDLSALAALRPHWRSASIGVLGGGNVGGLIASRLQQLGVDVAVCDPLLDPFSTGWPLVELADLLQRDIVLLHAPLTHRGRYPSYHLLGSEQLAALKPGALLLNAGRGGVIDNRALLDVLRSGAELDVVLDVWEQEPLVDAELLKHIAIATPHIAGYSLQGRRNGTAMVASALCDWLAVEAPSASQAGECRAELGAVSDLNAAILASCDLLGDDRRLREGLAPCADSDQRRRQFDLLRRHYPVRHQFSHWALRSDDPQLRSDCAQLGFQLCR